MNKFHGDSWKADVGISPSLTPPHFSPHRWSSSLEQREWTFKWGDQTFFLQFRMQVSPLNHLLHLPRKISKFPPQKMLVGLMLKSCTCHWPTSIFKASSLALIYSDLAIYHEEMAAYKIFLEPPASPSLSIISSTSAHASWRAKDSCQEIRKQFTLNWIENLTDQSLPPLGTSGDLSLPIIPPFMDQALPPLGTSGDLSLPKIPTLYNWGMLD